jgi:hypothetical protein
MGGATIIPRSLKTTRTEKFFQDNTNNTNFKIGAKKILNLVYL